MMFGDLTRDDLRSLLLPMLDGCFKHTSSAGFKAIEAHTPDKRYNHLNEDEKNQHDILSMGKLWLRLQPARDSEVYEDRYYEGYRATYPRIEMTYDDWMTILDVLEDDEYAEGAMMMDGYPAGERAVNARVYFLSCGIIFPTTKQDEGSEEDSTKEEDSVHEEDIADKETSGDDDTSEDGETSVDEKPTTDKEVMQEKSMGMKRVAEGPVGDQVPAGDSPPTKKQRQA